MTTKPIRPERCHRPRMPRRGSVLIMTMLFLVLLLGVVALSVDVGYMMSTKTELQRAADASALAGAWKMVSDETVRENFEQLTHEAREEALHFANLNMNGDAMMDPNYQNAIEGDILIGHLSNPGNLNERLSFSDIATYNTVFVRVTCSEERGTAIPLFFARIFGFDSVDLSAHSAAMFHNTRISSFRVTPNTGNASLVPMVVHIDSWNDLFRGNPADNWTYDSETKTIIEGSDGIPELKIFPNREKKSGNGQGNGSGIVPGNFGTVAIGDENNSADDLRRQIVEGLSADDLSFHGGELALDGTTGKLDLSGDPGVNTSIDKAIEKVIGHPRVVMLYDDVYGTGSGAQFTIVGFAGSRIVDSSLEGKDKYVLIQPAMVVDGSAVSGDVGISSFISQPVRLIRSDHLVSTASITN